MESTELDSETDSLRLLPTLLLLFKQKLSMSSMTSRELDSKLPLRKLGLRKKQRMPRLRPDTMLSRPILPRT
jgi:hypothetical protein